jgi:tRNA threonylcarbamoyladenosine biosynthesis protein TsaB
VSGLVLAFDTATPDTAVAVCDAAGEPLAERLEGPEESGRPRHGVLLLKSVEEAIAEAGGWEAVERIAVGIGPGSFTGIRIGVATARALAQARGLELSAVPSTAALTAGISAAEGQARIAVIDARRNEIFAALQPPAAAVAEAPTVLGPADAAGLLAGLQGDAAPLAAGDGSVRFRSDLEAAGFEVLPDEDPSHRLSARHIAALARGFAVGSPADVRPLYLRRPDAERWHERHRGDR